MTTAVSNDLPTHPFWQFSLELYRQSGVAKHCLALQDQYNTDVNILLFCCWLGHIGAPALSVEQLQQLIKRVFAWREQAIMPLRLLRRRLKQGVDAVPKDYSEPIRQAIQRVEIDAEQVEQLILIETIACDPNPAQALSLRAETVMRNFKNYLSAIEITVDDNIRSHLQALLAATFPTLQNLSIETLFGELTH